MVIKNILFHLMRALTVVMIDFESRCSFLALRLLEGSQTQKAGIIKDVSLNSFCFSDKTVILTKRGFRFLEGFLP